MIRDATQCRVLDAGSPQAALVAAHKGIGHPATSVQSDQGHLRECIGVTDPNRYGEGGLYDSGNRLGQWRDAHDVFMIEMCDFGVFTPPGGRCGQHPTPRQRQVPRGSQGEVPRKPRAFADRN
jgi:hypothetical protein